MKARSLSAGGRLEAENVPSDGTAAEAAAEAEAAAAAEAAEAAAEAAAAAVRTGETAGHPFTAGGQAIQFGAGRLAALDGQRDAGPQHENLDHCAASSNLSGSELARVLHSLLARTTELRAIDQRAWEEELAALRRTARETAAAGGTSQSGTSHDGTMPEGMALIGTGVDGENWTDAVESLIRVCLRSRFPLWTSPVSLDEAANKIAASLLEDPVWRPRLQSLWLGLREASA